LQYFSNRPFWNPPSSEEVEGSTSKPQILTVASSEHEARTLPADDEDAEAEDPNPKEKEEGLVSEEEEGGAGDQATRLTSSV